MSEDQNCFICNFDLNKPSIYQASPDGYSVDCPRCGKFFLTDSAQAVMERWLAEDEGNFAILSHYARRRQLGERIPMINREQVKEQCERGTLPSVFEQADTLLSYIADQVVDPGFPANVLALPASGIIGARSKAGFLYCLNALEINGFIQMPSRVMGYDRAATITFDGWEHYDALKRGAVSGNMAFMAMEFGDPQLDAILKEHFRPAVEATGFQLFKLDDRPQAGLIDDRLRLEIKTSRFLISDLTHDNEGAYWEAGYAEGLGKPVIYTCEASKFEEKKTHFDTNHHLTITWDPVSPGEAVEKLKATIRFTFPEAKQQDEQPPV